MFLLDGGKTKEEDPEYAPFPEILDIEVSTICNGIPNVSGIESPCAFCYKSNTKHGRIPLMFWKNHGLLKR